MQLVLDWSIQHYFQQCLLFSSAALK